MLELNKFHVKRYILFKDTEINLRKGLTFLGGFNKSGKSLFFTGMEPTLYGKESRIRLPANSSTELEFTTISSKEKKDDYRVNVRTAKSSTYAVFKNEQDQHPHKIADAQELIRKAAVLPHPLFVSTVHLQGVRDHALLNGTPSSRADWLSGVLDLVTVYDGYYAQVKTKLDDLTKQQTRLLVIEDQYSELQGELPRNHSKLTAESYTKLQTQTAIRKERLAEITQQITKLRNQKTLLSTVPKTAYVEGTTKSLKSDISILMKDIQRLEDELESARDYENTVSSTSKDQSRLEKLESKFEGVDVAARRKHVGAKVESLMHSMAYFKENMELWNHQKDLRVYLKSVEDESTGKHTLASIKDTISDVKYQLRSLKDRGMMLRDVNTDNKTCPSCGSELNAKHLKQELQETREKYNALTSKIERLVHIGRILEARSETLVKKPKIDPTEAFEKARREQALIEELLDLRDTLRNAPKKPKRSVTSLEELLEDKEGALEKLQSRYESIASTRTFLDNAPAWLENIYKTGSKAVKAQSEKVDQTIEELVTEQEELLDTLRRDTNYLTQYEGYAAARKASKASLTRLEDQIADLKSVVKDIEPLKALVTAFGTSGLRLQQLKESADILSQKMTEMSSLFYGDAYTFDIVAQQRKLELRIKRNGIDGGLSSMSGSESRFFHLLFAMSLLHLLPHRLRCDTMILDELDSTQDAVSRSRYTKDILPELATLVPKIVVVSPLISGELAMSADYDLRVTKTFKRGQYVSEILEA